MNATHSYCQTYIFEVVEVVPDQSSGPKRWYRLKLRCRDDAKGPVTALCGINNYLVSSMGQKVSFLRQADSMEFTVCRFSFGPSTSMSDSLGLPSWTSAYT